MRSLIVPSPIQDELAGGAALIISLSGGEDSQAMLTVLAAGPREQPMAGADLVDH